MPRSDEDILGRLEEKALRYLGRYASTGARLEAVLLRFARLRLPGEDEGRMEALVRRQVGRCIDKGYVDDRHYARRRAEVMRLQGASRHRIRQQLRHAGVEARLAEEAIGERDGEDGPDAEAEAALVYARRRRLGPFARRDRLKDGWRERHFGSLARAGFNPDIAHFVLDFDSEEAAQAWLDLPESR